VFDFLKRHKVKDKAALHASLVQRGYEPPHHDEDDAFNTFLGTIMTEELLSDMSPHFETPSVDPGPSFDASSAVDTGSSFDSGGGASGGGGADGAW
jgi:uncharacterized membrane protein YgcG